MCRCALTVSRPYPWVDEDGEVGRRMRSGAGGDDTTAGEGNAGAAGRAEAEDDYAGGCGEAQEQEEEGVGCEGDRVDREGRGRGEGVS